MVTSHVSVKSLVNIKSMDVSQTENRGRSCDPYVIGKVKSLSQWKTTCPMATNLSSQWNIGIHIHFYDEWNTMGISI